MSEARPGRAAAASAAVGGRGRGRAPGINSGRGGSLRRTDDDDLVNMFSNLGAVRSRLETSSRRIFLWRGSGGFHGEITFDQDTFDDVFFVCCLAWVRFFLLPAARVR
jgi:hypothetical protein